MMRRLGMVLAVAVAVGPAALWAATAGDAVAARLLLNTATLVAGVLAISLPAGTAAAVYAVRTDGPGRGVVMVLLGVLLVVPTYLQASVWLAWFTLPGWSAVSGAGGGWFSGMTAAVCVHGVCAVPWVAVVVGLGLRFVEPELEEESLLAAGAGTVFLRVTLRRAAVSVCVAALWVSVLVATDISVTDLFQVRTYAEEIFTREVLGSEPGQAPLAAVPVVSLFAWLAAAAGLVGVFVAPAEDAAPTRPPWRYRLGRWRWWAGGAVVGTLGCAVLVPVVGLARRAGMEVTREGEQFVRWWSVGKAAELVVESPGRFGEEILWSVWIGLAVATATVAAAAALAWLARRGRIGTAVTIALVGAAAAVPGPLVGKAVATLLSWSDGAVWRFLYDRTIVAPWLAQVVRCIGPTTLVCWHALRSVPGETLEAAATEGADAVMRWWRVGLGQRRGAVAAGWLVAWILSWGELSATMLTVPPGVTPITVRVFGLLHYGVDDQVAAVCLMQVVVFAVMAGVLLRVVRGVGGE